MCLLLLLHRFAVGAALDALFGSVRWSQSAVGEKEKEKKGKGKESQNKS